MIQFKPMVRGREHTIQLTIKDKTTLLAMDIGGWQCSVGLARSRRNLGSIAEVATTAPAGLTGTIQVTIPAETTTGISDSSVIVDVSLVLPNGRMRPVVIGVARVLSESEYRAQLAVSDDGITVAPRTSADIGSIELTLDLQPDADTDVSVLIGSDDGGGAPAIDMDAIVNAVLARLSSLPVGEYSAGDTIFLVKTDGSIVRADYPELSQAEVFIGSSSDSYVLVGISSSGEVYIADTSSTEVVVDVGTFSAVYFSDATPTTVLVDIDSSIGSVYFYSGSDDSVLLDIGEAAAISVPAGRISTLGNQFVDSTGRTVRLRSVNWFGGEGTNHTPHGTWARAYTDIIDDIADMGFNCIRMPFHGGWSDAALTPPETAFDAALNPSFVGATALEILDQIIEYSGSKGLRVVLDHHRRTPGAGADGSPEGAGYNVGDWLATWAVMANRYRDNLVVIGADVHNEPHSHTWVDWASLVEQCGNMIHLIAPDWIIFAEGVGEYDGASYWWGGQLAGVATRPITLDVPNKLAYSPHEYGVSVGEQSWLKSNSNTSVPNWPANLYSVWQAAWGFIFEQSIAPIWIGEFGGHFGVDGSGTVGAMPNGTYEAEWVTELCKYLNGDIDGDGNRDIPETDKGMSFSYWSFNPNSGDTGGLVQDDWVTRQDVKLALIDPVLDATPAEVLNIGSLAGQNHFKVQLAEDGAAEITTVSLAAIESGFEQSPYFTVVGNAVQFQTRIDGPTTAGSSYARAELREVNADGTDAGFDALTGVHWIRGKTAIHALPTNKPEVVVMQLFNGSADRIAIRTQLISSQTKLVCRVNGSAVTPRLMEPYVLGTEFEWMVRLDNGLAEIYFNDMTTPLITSTDLVSTGSASWYFKAGAYAQSNETLDDPSEIVNVTHRAIAYGHE